MTYLGQYLTSLNDEKSRGSDAYNYPNTIYKLEPNRIVYGTLSNSLDKDYFKLDVVAGNSYEIYLTSDYFNYGWNSNRNGSNIEFDIVSFRCNTNDKLFFS